MLLHLLVVLETRMLKLLLVFGAFTAVFAANHSLGIKDYVKAVDKAVKSVSQPILASLPTPLINYQHLARNKPTPKPKKNTPRYDVILQNVTLKSIGSIKRQGTCKIPDLNETFSVECLYKIKDYSFSGIGKNGEDFNEKITFTLTLATYSLPEPDQEGNIWQLWSPWAPGSAENKPTYRGRLSSALKKYLKEVDKAPITDFREYLVSTFENLFFQTDKLTAAFREALKQIESESIHIPKDSDN